MLSGVNNSVIYPNHISNARAHPAHCGDGGRLRIRARVHVCVRVRASDDIRVGRQGDLRHGAIGTKEVVLSSGRISHLWIQPAILRGR